MIWYNFLFIKFVTLRSSVKDLVKNKNKKHSTPTRDNFRSSTLVSIPINLNTKIFVEKGTE